MKLRKAILFLFLFCAALSRSQDGWPKEKLLHELKSSIHDTVKADILNELTWPVYSYTDFDSSVFYGKKAVTLCEKIGDLKRLSIAHRRIGITYSNFGKLRDAVYNEERSFALSDSIGFARGKFLALNNIGVAYLNSEQLNSALKYFLECTELAAGSNDNNFLSRLYMNIGNIYRRLQQYNNSKKYFLLADHYALASGNSGTRINALCNLGGIYRTLGQLDSAHICIEKAISLPIEKSDAYARMNLLLAQGQLLSIEGNHADALKIFTDALKVSTGLSDEITILINIAEQHQWMKDLKQALICYQKAFALSEKNRMYNNMEYICRRMGEVYDQQGDFRSYSHVIKQYLVYRDSNESINKAQDIIARQLAFDFQRKHVADSVQFMQKGKMQDLELQMSEEKLKRERILKFFLYGGIVLLIVLAGFISNRLRLTNKQKLIIEKQKKIVEMRNHEITDSINYSKRLQSAILPQKQDIRSKLDYDIFYQPKDIIGGDFYFFQFVRGKMFVAVCDCTGHGIPGALMSVVCHEALCDAILAHELSDPAAILSKTREIIIENLNASQQKIQDGMEASLLVIDPASRKVEWCGAFTPLYYCSDGIMQEIKGDKQSVSYGERMGEFTTRTIDPAPGTVFYLFTDGYADQFGGPGGKKFKYKPMKELMLSVSKEPVSVQAQKLSEIFDEWRGDLEQVDDVAVAVIRV